MKAIFIAALSCFLIQTINSACVRKCDYRTNFVGSSYKTQFIVLRGTTIEDCCQACIDNIDCKYFNFVFGFVVLGKVRPPRCNLFVDVVVNLEETLVFNAYMSSGTPVL